MPITRNTSSSGAPKRSASRLDRIPAITRTAPSNMAKLNEARGAIHLPGTNCWNVILYRRCTGAPTHFLPRATFWPHFADLTCITGRCIDGRAAAFVEFCRSLESNPFSLPPTRPPDGHGPQDLHGVRADDGTQHRGGSLLAL